MKYRCVNSECGWKGNETELVPLYNTGIVGWCPRCHNKSVVMCKDEPLTPPLQGWQCPVCRRVLSPWTSVCPQKHAKCYQGITTHIEQLPIGEWSERIEPPE